MTARSSDRPGPRPAREIVGNERGAVLAVVALTLIVLLASTGLAIDLGRGYIAKVRIARAVDAGALAGARTLRSGEAAAREEAEAVARANGIANGIGDIETELTFGMNDRGENTVVFSANRTLPTTFMRVVNRYEMEVSATAEAAVPPLDVVLILDTSGSLAQMGAWGALQNAAISFVQNFSDQLDQMGLVSFQIGATNLHTLSPNFRIPITYQINGAASAGDTNIGEGFRLAREQITGFQARPSAAKVVVFFTDGRATAVRGTFGGQDRIMAVFTTGNSVRGFFNNPDAIPPFQILYPSGSGQANWPGGCPTVPVCMGMNEADVRSLAAQRGLDEAAQLRQAGVLVYSIGLGDPNASNPLLTPDLAYLRQVANESGVSSADEPQGKMYFAPSGAQLEAVFQEVAQDLIVRLAR